MVELLGMGAAGRGIQTRRQVILQVTGKQNAGGLEIITVAQQDFTPGALQGEIAISLPEHIRLVMVAETPPSLTEPLIGDILRALAVTPDQVLQLTPERVAMLPQDSRCNSWRLGTEASLPLAGAQVSTPAFDELQTSAPARRALWQQICAHEHDFYPQHG